MTSHSQRNTGNFFSNLPILGKKGWDGVKRPLEALLMAEEDEFLLRVMGSGHDYPQRNIVEISIRIISEKESLMSASENFMVRCRLG